MIIFYAKVFVFRGVFAIQTYTSHTCFKNQWLLHVSFCVIRNWGNVFSPPIAQSSAQDDATLTLGGGPATGSQPSTKQGKVMSAHDLSVYTAPFKPYTYYFVVIQWNVYEKTTLGTKKCGLHTQVVFICKFNNIESIHLGTCKMWSL